jgi:phage terminase small subunit
MPSGKHRKFAERIVAGLTATDAYPKSSPENARKNSPRLIGNETIKAEIQQLRNKADEMAGSAVMTLIEQRKFLARLVRINVATLDVSRTEICSAAMK